MAEYSEEVIGYTAEVEIKEKVLIKTPVSSDYGKKSMVQQSGTRDVTSVVVKADNLVEMIEKVKRILDLEKPTSLDGLKSGPRPKRVQD